MPASTSFQATQPIMSPTTLFQADPPVHLMPASTSFQATQPIGQVTQMMPDWKILVDSLTSQITTQVTAQLKDTFIGQRPRAPLATLFNGVNSNVNDSQQIVSDLKTELVKAMANSCGLEITR